MAQKAFARETNEQWKAEGVQGVEVGEQREVLVEGLAEAEAGIEDDGVACDTGDERCVGAGFQFTQDEWEDFSGC